MNIDVDLIQGIAVGIEYVEPFPEEDIPRTIIVDIVLLRFVIQW